MAGQHSERYGGVSLAGAHVADQHSVPVFRHAHENLDCNEVPLHDHYIFAEVDLGVFSGLKKMMTWLCRARCF
jgi:hypothetical protein